MLAVEYYFSINSIQLEITRRNCRMLVTQSRSTVDYECLLVDRVISSKQPSPFLKRLLEIKRFVHEFFNYNFFGITKLVQELLDVAGEPAVGHQETRVDSWCVTDGVRKEKERLTAAK